MATKKLTKAGDIYYGTPTADKITVSGSGNNRVYADSGKDKITVTRGNYHTIYGDESNDTITVKKGNHNELYGNKGNDSITVKGNYHTIYGDDTNDYSNYKGNDTITLAGGTGHKVWAGKGNDKIYVKKGAGFECLLGGAGNDTITVYKGAKAGKKSDHASIDGDEGNNKITVTNGKYYDIESGEGNDTIKINGGSYYEITDTGGKKNSISVTNANNFKIYTYAESKGTITISGGKKGSIGTSKTTVTVNSGSSHMVSGEGSKIIINGGKNLSIIDSDWEKTNEKVTINGGNGTVTMGDKGTETVTVDFGNGKNKVGNWDISANYLSNNRLTVLGASSTEFDFKRDFKTMGSSQLLYDRWIITKKSTGATITLDGWYSNWTKTFDIYFKKDNVTVSGVPAKAEVDYLNLH